MKKLEGKRIVIVIAPSMFRDEEFKVPYDYLKSSGAEVKVASTTLSEATGKLGMKVKPDITINKINPDEFDAIIFVGGPGVKQFWNDKTIHNIAVGFYNKKKITAAICSAPVILARAGLLEGKNATSFPGDEDEMKKGGCHFTGKITEKDGIIITGNGPAASQSFASLIEESI